MRVEKPQYRPRVHRILAHSYMVYLMSLFVGLIFTSFWPLKFIEDTVLVEISVIILFLSTLLILWAQKHSKKINKENLSKESFMKGPFRFTRNPTNLGLFLSIICFGFIINSIPVVFFVLIAFLFSRLIFVKKEEELLESKYGAPYREYKKIVKF